ncbi:MAG: hypothetical protein HY593_05670 [Candidatus Omnitrophica bacterium]|nr:hypothetical protein [Candidatus Omnitrophota bacterium]
MLPLVLTHVLVFAIGVAALSEYAGHAARQVRSHESYLKTFCAAEAATEKTAAQIRLFLEKNGDTPTSSELSSMANRPPSMGELFSFQDASLNNTLSAVYAGSDWENKVLTVGDYSGFAGSVRTIRVSVMARNTTGVTPAVVTVTQTLELQRIPLFQFGIFYDTDLEILPGGGLTWTGLIHGNADVYLGTGSGSSLRLNSPLFAAGNIYHGRKDSNDPMPGDVWVKDSADVDQNMKNADGTWLDSRHADWLMGAYNRWDARVLSSVQGTGKVRLLLPSGSGPEVLIDRRSAGDSVPVQSQKMDAKADIRIVDGVVMDQAGNGLELRYCSGGGAYDNGCPEGQSVINPIGNKSFYNAREARLIQSTDIDVSLLKQSPNFRLIADARPGVVLYVSDHTNAGSLVNQDAVRLVNASSLPLKGMTLASDNPVYVKGNFNTVSKQAAGIIGDSFNILSNRWRDSDSFLGLGARKANDTTVNAAVIAGNTNTTEGNYSGGFENLPRLLETWTGDTLTYSGSMAALYTSRMATGGWSEGSVYTPPRRNWSFDPAFSNPAYSIPGFPSVYHVVKSSYEVS